MRPKRYFLLILILGTLSAIGPFSIDMYLPGFPAIARDLDTTVAHIALSLSSFFIGISTGQLFYGPLLDRFGRKKPLYFGLSLYVLASVGCALATTADALIALRFFQALGGCVGMVASRAMVRDIFPVNESARVFSTLMLVIGVSPLVAPTLGGYVSTVFGWHYVFAILTLMGLLILLGVHFILPESRKADASFSLRPISILKNYYSVLIHPQFYTYTFSGAIAGAGLYSYIAGSPFVFMEMFKVSGQHYGWIFAFIAMGLIGSSQMNSLLLKRGFKSERIIVWALLCQSFAGIMLFIAAINGWLNAYNAVGMICIFLCCQGFIFPNASALALAPFSKNAGSASALLGGFQMGLGALASALVSMLSNNTALPMTGLMATCATTSFCLLLMGNRIVRYKASVDTAEEETAEVIKTF
jgi:DHA1 family bicyclomycin/chloramphenicol resistance-like MFS transporter